MPVGLSLALVASKYEASRSDVTGKEFELQIAVRQHTLGANIESHTPAIGQRLMFARPSGMAATRKGELCIYLHHPRKFKEGGS